MRNTTPGARRRLAPLASLAALAAATLWTSIAGATPRDLPFTYPYQTLGEGELEIEQYADVTPVKATSTASGGTAWVAPPAFQTEFEYGVTDRLELALYVVYAPSLGSDYADVPEVGDTGIRQRLRYRFADEGEWPVDVALYGEVSELTSGLELEGKVILQKRIADLTLMANLVGSYILSYQPGVRTFEVAPSAGVTYQVTPVFHPGIEWWMHVDFPSEGVRDFDDGTQHYVGPVAMLDFGKLWWSTGVYLRATDPGHVLDAGESWGKVWARTVVGLSF